MSGVSTVFKPKKNNHVYCSNECTRRQANRRHAEKQGHAPRVSTFFHKNRLLALQRDKVCQTCGSEGPLLVHHWDGSGETDSPNHALDNLRVLCGKYHKQLHQIDYRIIDGKLFVLGKIFEVMGVQSVEVLP